MTREEIIELIYNEFKIESHIFADILHKKYPKFAKDIAMDIDMLMFIEDKDSYDKRED